MSLGQSNPLVTVYIPTFNRVELLKRAVESVRQQTYQNLEIIIVDDCSNDNTHGYLEEITKRDSRIRYFIKEKNSGACVSRNIAIENAKGEFITGLDDDDYFLKDRLELFVKEVKNEDDILFTNLSVLENGGIKYVKKYKIKVGAIDLLYNNYIGNQVFIKTAILKNCKGFDSKMRVWQDLEAWFNILKKNNCKARLINNYSYVLDISHEKDRISNSNKDKILNSYLYFVKKHNLNYYEAMILKSHIYNYFPEEISLKVIVYKLLTGFNFYDLKKLLKFFYRF